MYTEDSKECCPKFDPKPLNEKTHHWENKLFIKDSIPQFLHIPFPPMIGKMIQKQWKLAQDAKADPKIEDFLWLSYDPSPWKSEHYIAVTKKVANAVNVMLSGIYISKVFDGPFNSVPKWIKEMDEYLAKEGKKPQKYYFYFTTCPKCAKKYGHNFVVIFAQVA